MRVKAYDRSENLCYRLPTCRGLHIHGAHDRVQEERAVYATVFENGDPDLGMRLVFFHILPLLDLIRMATRLPRCWRCGKVGPTCEVYTTMETQPDGTKVQAVHYCGID